MSWDEFDKRGMMTDTYRKAFDVFLYWAELDWPPTPINPIVQLFLLVCDLATNPSEGYPFDLQCFESFIVSVDPGFRFAFFSREIARHKRFAMQQAIVAVTSTLKPLSRLQTPWSANPRPRSHRKSSAGQRMRTRSSSFCERTKLRIP